MGLKVIFPGESARKYEQKKGRVFSDEKLEIAEIEKIKSIMLELGTLTSQILMLLNFKEGYSRNIVYIKDYYFPETSIKSFFEKVQRLLLEIRVFAHKVEGAANRIEKELASLRNMGDHQSTYDILTREEYSILSMMKNLEALIDNTVNCAKTLYALDYQQIKWDKQDRCDPEKVGLWFNTFPHKHSVSMKIRGQVFHLQKNVEYIIKDFHRLDAIEKELMRTSSLVK